MHFTITFFNYVGVIGRLHMKAPLATFISLLAISRNCGAASVGEIKTKIWFYQTS